MKERKDLIKWIKKNKKKIAVVGIGTLILVILGIKNKDAIKALWDSLKEATEHPSTKTSEAVTQVISEVSPEPVQEAISVVTSTSESIPFEVSRHVRTLPRGWRASPEKVAAALENNIALMEGQTWVDSYVKGGTAA